MKHWITDFWRTRFGGWFRFRIDTFGLIIEIYVAASGHSQPNGVGGFSVSAGFDYEIPGAPELPTTGVSDNVMEVEKEVLTPQADPVN